MKKVLSVLAVLALVLSCTIIGIGTVAFAATESPEADFAVFDGVLEEYLGPGGDVVIPASLAVKEIASMAFYKNEDITSIVIPEGVEIIGAAAFMGCVNMESAQLPYSLLEICQTSFNECGLTSILIPGNVHTISMGAFSKNNLSKIEFSYGVKEIESSAFNHNYICDVVFPETVELICGFSFVFPQNSGSWEFTICNPDCEVGYYADTVKKNAEHSWDTLTCPIAYSSLSATQAVSYVVPKDSAVGKYIEDNFENYLKDTAGTACDLSKNRQIVKYKDASYFENLEQNKEDFGIVSAPEEGDTNTPNDNTTDDDEIGEINKNNQGSSSNKNQNNTSGGVQYVTQTGNSATTLIIIVICVFGGIMLIAIIAVVVLAAMGKFGGTKKEKAKEGIDPEALAAAMAILEAKKAAQAVEVAEETETEEN